jgi:hypothetical protein
MTPKGIRKTMKILTSKAVSDIVWEVRVAVIFPREGRLMIAFRIATPVTGNLLISG